MTASKGEGIVVAITHPGPASSGPEPEASTSPALDEHTLVGLVERLSRRFPHLHPMEIMTAINDCLAETQGAKVQGFRVILAERSVGRRLMASTPSGTRAATGTTGSDGA